METHLILLRAYPAVLMIPITPSLYCFFKLLYPVDSFFADWTDIVALRVFRPHYTKKSGMLSSHSSFLDSE
jgi:hypothetical protein